MLGSTLTEYARKLETKRSTPASIELDLMNIGCVRHQIPRAIQSMEQMGLMQIDMRNVNAPIVFALPASEKPSKPEQPQSSEYSDEDMRNDGLTTAVYEPDPLRHLHPAARRRMQEQLAYVDESVTGDALGISESHAKERRKHIKAEAESYSADLWNTQLNVEKYAHCYRFYAHELEPPVDYGSVYPVHEIVDRAIRFCEERGRPTDAESIAQMTGESIDVVKGMMG